MQELLHGTGVFFLFIIPAVLVAIPARLLLKVPDELFRKLLHFLLLVVYAAILFSFETWWLAAIFALLIIVVFYPILALLEKLLPAFSTFVNERKRGEFCRSLVLALTVMAVSICICWGWRGERYLVLACIYAWGVGDGFAALIGKRFGRHKFHLRFADPHKSMEGSAAMFVTSTTAVLAVLLLRGGMDFGVCLLVALAAAAVSTFAELCSTGGYDTVSCPLAAMVVILPLVQLLGR